MDTLSILAGAAFFKGLGSESLKALAATAVLKRIERKAVLFMEGESGHSIFLLGSGLIWKGQKIQIL